jgi:hypothetical protein
LNLFVNAFKKKGRKKTPMRMKRKTIDCHVFENCSKRSLYRDFQLLRVGIGMFYI